MSPSQPTPQSAAARRAAEAQLHALILKITPAHQRLTSGVLALRASADEVRLYFNQGKGLPDPDKLLKGSAKLVRWIPVEGAATLKRPAVVTLIDQALVRNSIPFPKTGDGPVVIQSIRAR